MKKVEPSPFGQRLLEVIGEKVPKEQVREKLMEILGIQRSAITNYLKNRIPDADKLQVISSFTNCSIHWLITGEGEKYLNQDAAIDFDSTMRGLVREMIREELNLVEKNKAEILGENVGYEKEKELKPTPSPKK